MLSTLTEYKAGYLFEGCYLGTTMGSENENREN